MSTKQADVHFTRHALARCAEEEIDPTAVRQALEDDHFTQRSVEDSSRTEHFLPRVEGKTLRVVTGPYDRDPSITAVVTVVPIEIEARSGTMTDVRQAPFLDDPATILANPQWRDPEVE